MFIIHVDLDSMTITILNPVLFSPSLQSTAYHQSCLFFTDWVFLFFFLFLFISYFSCNLFLDEIRRIYIFLSIFLNVLASLVDSLPVYVSVIHLLGLLVSIFDSAVVLFCLGLQDRNNLLLDGRTVENKAKLILTEIFPSVQKHDI